jgi:hypothetical protein
MLKACLLLACLPALSLKNYFALHFLLFWDNLKFFEIAKIVLATAKQQFPR